jgi:hypothetical protein
MPDHYEQLNLFSKGEDKYLSSGGLGNKLAPDDRAFHDITCH